MSAKEQRCLKTGAIDFWVVDEKEREVRVTSGTAPMRIYKPGQSIPKTLFGVGVELSVDAIFA